MDHGSQNRTPLAHRNGMEKKALVRGSFSVDSRFELEQVRQPQASGLVCVKMGMNERLNAYNSTVNVKPGLGTGHDTCASGIQRVHSFRNHNQRGGSLIKDSSHSISMCCKYVPPVHCCRRPAPCTRLWSQSTVFKP